MTRRLRPGPLVVATHNAGKLEEIRLLLEPLGFAVAGAGELGLAEPEETEETFAGNARIKAHAAAGAAGRPALSDDSGLDVTALDGRPGVHTADWAETPTGRDFRVAMERMHRELTAVGAPEPWAARFVCTFCIAWPDGADAVVQGDVAGRVVWPPRGTRGFGFDPVFVPQGGTETFGEMAPERKHAISHRAAAFVKLLEHHVARG